MLLDLLVRIMTLFVLTEDAEALQRTAPEPITIEAARANIAAARIAGAIYRLDADLLLSIAAHESRYQVDATTPERGGKVSCGVMTPKPLARCPVGQTLLDGYLAGAAHIRNDWLTAMHGNELLALQGVAGGGVLINACKLGPVWIRPGVDACKTPQVFWARADWIKRERTRVRWQSAQAHKPRT